MRFNNGCWIMKEGTEKFSPMEVHFARISDDKVVICAPTHLINHRGDTLGGANLYIEVTSPMEEVLRVRTYHHKGIKKYGPDFEVNDKTAKLSVEENDEKLTVSSGKLRLEITKKYTKLSFFRGNELITESANGSLALIKTDWKGTAYDKTAYKPDSDTTFMREMLSIDVNEFIYGLGERFTAFIKNGQAVDIWNEDGGTSSYQSYKNIPFYISNRGYGVFVDHPEKVSFEVATEVVTKVQFSVPGEELDFYLFNGPDMKSVLSRYTALTGRPPRLPAWSFGLWLSTSFTTNYDEETVMSFVDGMKERGIPLKVFHFDCFWMREFAWTNFIWDPKVFPNPAGMIKRLHERGLKVCVWINPYIGQDAEVFDEGMEHGYFIKREDGSTWQWDMWQPGMAIVDFTNPEATEWYQKKLEALMDMGVDCFKTDFGERIPTDCVYADGSDPTKMHNYYTYLYNKAVYEVIEKKKGEGEAILFARSATAGGQKFPVHWGGDCWSDYVSMEESLRGGLSLAMSGFGFWSHDIGGFEDKSTADVYKRWCAFGLLSTHSRLHGSTSYRVPWNYDDEAVEVVKKFTKLKASLMPYLYRNAIDTWKTGVPMLRSMVLEFTEDMTAPYLDKQYMLGDSLLVAPIFNNKGIARYYLPNGQWTNFFTGEVREGGKWYEEYHDYMSIPLFVRPGAIIPVGACDTDPVYDYAEGVTYKVYALSEGETARTMIFGTDGNPEDEIWITKREGKYEVEKRGPSTCKIEIVGSDIEITEVSGDVTRKILC